MQTIHYLFLFLVTNLEYYISRSNMKKQKNDPKLGKISKLYYRWNNTLLRVSVDSFSEQRFFCPPSFRSYIFFLNCMLCANHHATRDVIFFSVFIGFDPVNDVNNTRVSRGRPRIDMLRKDGGAGTSRRWL